MTLKKKLLFWVILCSSITILAIPSVVLFENIRKFMRIAPEDPGLSPTRTNRVPHGSGTIGAPQPQFVKFTLKSKDAKAVFLAGDFNLWRKDKLPLKSPKKGEWTALVPLPPGRYRYRFVVDGAEVTDPANKQTEKVDDELVSVKDVP